MNLITGFSELLNILRSMQQSSLRQVQDRLSARAAAKQRLVPAIRLTVIVGAAYFLAARLSLFLLTQPDGVAPFWPAAGVSSGFLIALGRGARWPVAIGVVAATTVANLTSDRNVVGSIVFALCDAGEALLAAWLVERYAGLDFSLARVRHVLWLLAAAIIATACSGIAGAVAYKLFHSPEVPALITWQHWASSDAIGIITVAPLMVSLAEVVRRPLPPREIAEGVAALVAVAAAVAIIIFVFPEAWWNRIAPVELLFPFLLWLAARCRPAFTAAAVFVVSLMIASAVIFRLGLFGEIELSMADQVFAAQAGTVGVAIFAFVLAALFAERRRNEAVITESENRLRTIVNTVVDGIITIDDHGTIENLNPAAARVFGYRPDDVIGRSVEMLMPEFYERELYGEQHDDARIRPAKMIGFGREVIGKRKDGSIVPVELAVSDMEAAGRKMFTGVVRDITERKRAEQHQELLVAELDHRVKNILAQVAVVAASTRQGSSSTDEFLLSLDGRIQSMAAAHTLLSRSGWQSVGLDALVRNQLTPYMTGANVTISGPEVMLASAETQAVSRVLHELATNAAKYGALSMPGGQVSVTWEFRLSGRAPSLALLWREIGGPAVPPNVQPSYGTNLIRNLIPHELGGAVDLAFAAEGVSCRIEIPIKRA
jgi:PAS domain S-box-containing protein